ncbi:MAG: hypothetical protein JNM30_21900 [Rhodospirillales bacterium]|nr:hypothetical protein [Rhodospirillales bacterium]
MTVRFPLAALPLALLLAAPAAAEDPRVHQRQPERYQAVPLPGQQARPGAGATDTADPEQRRGGFYRPPGSKKADDDDGKRETVGNERLWTTRDPPGKRGVFAFLGNKIGDPIDNVFPDMEEKDQFGMPLCRDTPGLPGFLDCTDDSIRVMVNGVWKLMYRGVEVSFVNYRYLDGKLAGFRMGFPTANFQALAEALKKQYGPPTGEEETSWTHRLGGVFDIKIQSWNTPHGEMTLRSRAAAMDAGMLALMEPKAQDRFNDLRYRQVLAPNKPLGPPEDEFVLHPLPPKPGETAQPAVPLGNAAPAKAAP